MDDNSKSTHLNIFTFLASLPIGESIDTVYGNIERSSELDYKIEFKDLEDIEQTISSISIMGGT